MHEDARAFLRRHPGYEPTDPPPAPSSPVPDKRPSFMARAAATPLTRTLALIVAASTGVAGVITATGAVIVNVIDSVTESRARRTNAEIDRRIDAIETRVNADFGLPLETKTRQEKDDELEHKIERLQDEMRKARVP